jgi:hypothetical protein
MVVSANTVQQATSSVPIVNIQPPPEGQMAAKQTVVLTPGIIEYDNVFQLSSQSGLLLSQVVTLIIDNSQNAYPLAVVHGALAENLQVAALSVVIVPTFSARAGGYPLQITAIEQNTPAVNLNIDVIFMNYPRPPGTFSATNQATIIATGQNTNSLVAVTANLPAGSNLMLSAGNYIFDSLDIACEGFNPTAAGTCSVPYQLLSGPQVIQTGDVVFTAADASWIQGGQINQAGQRTWPQGLLLGRGRAVTLSLLFYNITQAIFRVNISGVSTP